MDERQKRIDKEIKRLKKLYKDIPVSKKEMIKELINKASFLLILSQDIETSIKNLEDFTITTINATQEFTKPNPLFKEYRDTVKSYQTVIKQLNDLVKNCEHSDKSEPDELEAFIK